MWLKKAVGITLIITMVGLFGLTIGGVGFTRSDKVMVLNPDGSTTEMTVEQASNTPNLVELSTSAGTSAGSSQTTSTPATGNTTQSATPAGSTSTTSSSTPTTSSGSTAPSTSSSGTSGGGTVVSKPVITMSISPSTITSGGSSTINWSASNSPTSCSASGSWSGAKSSSGSQSTGTKTAGSYIYSLTCANAGGSSVASVGQTVTAPVVTYCGGLSPCYGVGDMAAHATSGSCWGRSRYRTGGSYDRVYNLNKAYSGTSKHSSYVGSSTFYQQCGKDFTVCVNGSSSCGGSRTLNHSSGDLASYSSPIGYYDPSKP